MVDYFFIDKFLKVAYLPVYIMSKLVHYSNLTCIQINAFSEMSWNDLKAVIKDMFI